MKVGDQPVEFMAMKKTVMQGTNEDPQLLAMERVEVAQANVDNVSKLVEDVGNYKEIMSQMKETLRKERGEGQYLKRKHDDILSEFEKLKEAYKMLESYKNVLTLSVAINEGEKRDLEIKVLELEKKKATTDKRVEELETQNILLKEQLRVENEKNLDVTPFYNQACLLKREIN